MTQILAASVLVVVVFNALSTNGVLVVPSVVNSNNGAVPFYASLRTPSSRHFCGGSIIGPQWIITGAHCFKETIDQSKVKAFIGTDAFNKGGESYDIESVIIHPKFSNLSKTEYDITLLKTAQPIKLNEKVSFIPMSRESISISTDVYTESWVPTSSRKLLVLKMGFKKLLTVSNEYSAKVLKLGYGKSISNSLICAVPENRIGNHRTVSGGALIANDMLVGISSWDPSPINAAGKPDLFTRIASHGGWIKNVTGIELY